jgi:ComF family protein
MGVAVCPACYRRRPRFDKVAAPYLHEGLARDLVHALKYRGHRHVAPILAAAMADAAPADVDVVVAVPLHSNRRAERGFNQSELLARAAAGRLALPLRLDALRRERPTRPQVELAHDERAANVLGAFVAPVRLDGTRVLLVDDVCTTGATLDACAAALKRAGASRVACLVATRASTTPP